MTRGPRVVRFDEALTLGATECAIAEQYRGTCAAPAAEFDLSDVRWVGHMPAAELFAWGATLAASKEAGAVSVRLPEQKDLSSQVSKALPRASVLSQAPCRLTLLALLAEIWGPLPGSPSSKLKHQAKQTKRNGTD
jgi:hypothetical protein